MFSAEEQALRLVQEQRFFELVRSGSSYTAACEAVGVDRRQGYRWRRARGVQAMTWHSGPISARYLSLEERLRIADLHRAGGGVREIAAALGRSEAAAQKLASRARQRMRTASAPDQDLGRQRQVMNAFFAAARDGNVEVLHPDVVLRIDGGILRSDASHVLHGAAAVSRHTATYARLFPFVRPAIVNGADGAVVITHQKPFAVMGFTIIHGRITQIDAFLDPERLAQLQLNPG